MTDRTTLAIRNQRQRASAVLILENVAASVSKGHPADSELAKIFKQHPEYGSRDRRFYSAVVFSYFRLLGWTRKLNLPGIEAQIAWSILIDPDSPLPVREIWRVTTGMTEQEAVAFDAMPLDNKLTAVSERFALGQFLPADLLPEWTANFLESADQLASLANACLSRPPTWVFIPPSRMPSFIQHLSKMNMQYETHPRIKGAVALFSSFHINQLEQEWGAPVQIQDISSRAVVEICEARTGDSWWDVCCGAGGKTLGLAGSVGADGCVFCTDVRASILSNLKIRAIKHGFENINMEVMDATSAAPHDRLFDGVLIDAPCSGMGTWPRNPDARWRMTPDMVDQKCAIQLRLLNQAARRVKSGGRLIYSVCSITHAEGPRIVRQFLEGNRSFVFEDFENPLCGRSEPGELTIMPNDGPGDGMYIARLLKAI